MADAPLMGDNLCDECREHYEQVKRYLDAAGIEYVEDPTLVRGLDYYTRTVFEVEAPGAGVGSIGGGGRYDGLVELEGGKPTAGVGFAVGFERALLALQAFGSDLAPMRPRASTLPTPARICVRTSLPLRSSFAPQDRDRGRLPGSFAQGPV